MQQVQHPITAHAYYKNVSKEQTCFYFYTILCCCLPLVGIAGEHIEEKFDNACVADAGAVLY